MIGAETILELPPEADLQTAELPEGPGAISFSELSEEEYSLGIHLNMQRTVRDRKVSVSVLRERHRAIARYLVAGFTHKEISKIIGCGVSTINLLLETPAFQGLLAEMRGEAVDELAPLRARLVSLGHLTLDRMEEKIASTDDGAFIHEVSKDTLNRLGVSGPVKFESRSYSLSMSEVKERVKNRARGPWPGASIPSNPASVPPALPPAEAPRVAGGGNALPAPAATASAEPPGK